MVPRSRRLGRLSVVGLGLAAVVGAAVWYSVAGGKPAGGGASAHGDEAKAGRPVSVDVVSPRPGGIDRVCSQPGTVEPFEAADLYAKVSGYLVEQEVERGGKKERVDIGTLVKAGDVLARISVPEYEKQVAQDEADVVRAEARVEQMTAAVTTAEADLGAATSGVALARAELKSKTSYRSYREKQRDRIKDLASRLAIDAKLADEQEDQFQAAFSTELAATEGVTAAQQKEAASRARVTQARADLKYAGAEVAVARARLGKSQVMLGYTIIRSPYTGVVTRRSFHPGDYVRSADAGGDRVPVLSVERTDVMRVVVYVPERDVPFVDAGDPAVVEVDALPGAAFKSTPDNRVVVSRLAASEDPHTRMMRVEVDLKNPDGHLRRGMYGRV
ncbi:MAG TPA: efflux RND transporter periplasmic adaptor subunit, partial [Urbifossiella sp.]|nr:efflux RND transporter periplasmic adaptor subunit [Urbifossiella sp.]